MKMIPYKADVPI